MKRETFVLLNYVPANPQINMPAGYNIEDYGFVAVSDLGKLPVKIQRLFGFEQLKMELDS